ncbi:hypothetical protein AB0M95_01955 [Sphaerisporangium sp. NPDC051017]|uniref:hypothetical protein n=1 Tax=Sphaerisporangium sp. NPDC051017 TaxID=3154636 RepID=UPI00342E7503
MTRVETGECRHCQVGIQRSRGGVWSATVRQHDHWGVMLSGHCPARGHVFGFRQPHEPARPQ